MQKTENQASKGYRDRMSKRSVIVWLLASLFFGYQYALRILPATLGVELMEHFGINAYQFGEFLGLYYLAYVAAHIPIGIITDRIGLRATLGFCVLAAALSQLSLIISDDFWVANLGRFINGAASSAGIIGVVKTITMAYPKERFPLMMGFSITIGLCGSIGSSALLYPFVQHLGFENTVIVLTGIGVILGAAVIIATPGGNYVSDEEEASWLSGLKTIFTADKVWILIALAGGLMVGGSEGFADAWAPQLITSGYSVDGQTANQLNSIMFFAYAVGGPLIGIIDRTFKINHILMLMIYGVVMLLSFVVMIMPFAYGNLLLLLAMLVITGLCFPYQSLVLAQALARLPQSVSALAAACANMVMMGCGPFFHILIGLIIEQNWNGTYTEAGNPNYGIQAISKGLSVIPMGIMVAIVALALIYFKYYRKRKVETL